MLLYYGNGTVCMLKSVTVNTEHFIYYISHFLLAYRRVLFSFLYNNVLWVQDASKIWTGNRHNEVILFVFCNSVVWFAFVLLVSNWRPPILIQLAVKEHIILCWTLSILWFMYNSLISGLTHFFSWLVVISDRLVCYNIFKITLLVWFPCETIWILS